MVKQYEHYYVCEYFFMLYILTTDKKLQEKTDPHPSHNLTYLPVQKLGNPPV